MSPTPTVNDPRNVTELPIPSCFGELRPIRFAKLGLVRSNIKSPTPIGREMLFPLKGFLSSRRLAPATPL